MAIKVFNGSEGDDVVRMLPDIGSYDSTTIYALGGNDIVFGTVNDENLIYGGTGDDTITGGGLFDTLHGDEGDDQLDAEQSASSELYGGTGGDFLLGSANAACTLDGGEGADTMIGGKAGDQYVVDEAGDVVIETYKPYYDGDPNPVDLVLSSVTFTLGANLENLTLAGDAAIDGTGNALANQIVGTTGANRIDGGRGNDSISGGAGNDTLIGGLGNDSLIGAGGTDTVEGGAGNDIFGVNDAADVIVESVGGGSDEVLALVSYALDADVEVETLRAVAGGGDIGLTGNGFDNLILGNEGSNSLDGAGGNDTVSYAAAQVGVTVSLALATGQNTGAGSDTLAGFENLTGSYQADNLTGTDAANVLDGSYGADTLTGGAGGDTYIVDSGDVVNENSAVVGEIDTVRANTTWTLGANLENLVLTGGAAIGGTGNALGNLITGTIVGNLLDGAGGDDTLDGGAGNDTLVGGGGLDLLIGGAGSDVYRITTSGQTVQETGTAAGDVDTIQVGVNLTMAAGVEKLTMLGSAALAVVGNALANDMTGNDGANTLDGGAGVDTMRGGDGNDLYLVNQTGDQAIEAFLASGGTDRVESLVSFTLGTDIENLTLLGSAGLSGTGNTGNNQLRGNSGNNLLSGLSGNDSLYGEAGNDVLIGSTGNDSLDGGDGVDTASFSTATAAISVSLALTGAQAVAGLGADTLIRVEGLIGSAYDDTLTGSNGSDSLDGGAGNDSLVGGNGNDTYVVNSLLDKVVETGTSGSTADLVRSTITWTLGSTVENLTLIGLAASNGTGNSLANTLTGNAYNNLLSGSSGNDTILGGSGADTLVGGSGNDSLSGNLGADQFRFAATLSSLGNVDRLADFSSVDDSLALDDAYFAQVGAVGALAAAAFRAGTAAADASDRVIYNSATGQLFYDADGNGSGAAVLFATVAAGTTIVLADFIVI